MNCPHCHKPTPDAAVIKAAASINGARKRPGAKGLTRTGCHHVAPELIPSGHSLLTDCVCLRCHRSIRWSKARKTFLLVPKKEAK